MTTMPATTRNTNPPAMAKTSSSTIFFRKNE